MAIRKAGLFVVAALLSACGGGGSSGVSSDAPAALTFAVSAPTTATGVPLTIVIAGTASEALNAATVNSNTVAVAEVGGGPVLGTIDVNGASVTFTPEFPLAQNTQYMVTVTTGVRSVSGKTLAANVSQTFTTITVPGAPTIGSAAAGNAQATVTFTPVPAANNGGSAITGYTVTSNPGGITATGSGSPITVGLPPGLPLNNGTPYTFTVTATNDAGTGPPSAPSNSVTPNNVGAAPPPPPVIGLATPGDAQASVAFTPPACALPGCPTITNYVVTASVGGIATSITASGGASPIVVSGLTNGTTYTFSVRALNSAGASLESGASNLAMPAGPPGAPTGVGAVASAPGAPPAGQAIVTFNAPLNTGGVPITGYTVTSSPAGGIDTNAGTAGLSHLVTGLVVGTPYTFTVTATNGGPVPGGTPLTGPSSAPSGAVTPAPGASAPSQPATPSAVRGNAQATVTFVPPANNGSAIIDYTVTALIGGVPTAISASGGASPIVVPGLTNGTPYTFTVKARNSVGTGPDSPASNPPVTPATVPNAPTIGAATAGNGQVTVAFTPPANNGGSAITGYTVTPNPAGSLPPATGLTSPITVTGLTNGTAYTFTVTASNSLGTSSPSAVSNSATPNLGAVPGPPTGAFAVRGNQMATITFTPPADPGGSAITSYTATASPGGVSATGTTTSIPVTGLTNGTAYTFTVTATNSAGAGPASAPSNAVSPATNPAQPTAVTASAGNTQATVSFTPPSDNGSPISNYLVTAFDAGVPSGHTASGAASPIAVNGLSNGTPYTFTVTAFNGVGPGPASAPSAAVTPTTSLTVSGPPTGATAVRGDAQATVSFTPPAGFTAPGCALPACSPVTTYTVTSNPGGVTATGAATSIPVTGLTNGTAYTFTVVANNGVGPSPASGASNSVTPAGIPSQPTAPVPTAGPASASVAFSAPASNGSPILDYTVRAYTFAGHVLSGTATAAASPIAISGLSNTQYVFTVTARNSVGNSLESGDSGVVTPSPSATVSSVPLNIVASNPGDGTVTVSFDPPASNGGSGINGYVISSNPPGGVDSGAFSSTLSRAVTNLTNGVAYTFTVVAINGVGSSPPSGASNSVTPKTVPGPPTLAPVSAIAGNGLVTVSFTPPVNNGGDPAITYLVTSNPGGISVSGSASPIIVSPLNNGTTYDFTVSATNSVGTSSPNPTTNSVTPTAATAPTAPTIGSASSTGVSGQASVSFTPPVGFTAPGCALPACSPVTSYTVTSSPSGFSQTGAASPIVVSGLANGTGYTFRVVATNSIGDSPASAATAVPFTPTTTPDPPTGVAASPGNMQATVSFTPTPPANNGGSPITGYRVFCVSGAPCPVSVDGTTSPITVTGLTNGNTYTFRVGAINAANGLGALSAVSNSVIPLSTPPACSGTTAAVAGPISLRAVAARSSGVSPLAVFFDATATTSSATMRPFHELEYRWTFGDPAGGATWGRGTRPGVYSKNEALGPVAAHVFEPAPGSGTQTYTVVVTATDGTNTATCSIPISVTDPNAVFLGTVPAPLTVCVSATALPVAGADGCPAGAAVMLNTDFDAAIASAISAGRRRILFRKGENFFVSAAAQITTTGPGIIGSYGSTGTKANIVATANSIQIFRLSSGATPTVADWRVMDLDLDGLGGAPGSANLNVGVGSAGGYRQFTFLRVDLHDLKYGFSASAPAYNFLNTPTFTSPFPDQFAIVDSSIRRILGGAGNGGNGVFFVATRFMYMGNLIDDTTQGEHGLRSQFMNKGVISSNTHSNIARAAITLRGQPFAGTASVPPNSYTEQLVISDNLLLGSASTGIAGTGPQAPAFDERIRDSIWERNWFVAGSGTQGALGIEATSDITVRNNVFDMSAAVGGSAISVVDPGVAPAPDRIYILNNTVFRSTVPAGSMTVVNLGIGTTNHTIANNLARAPAGSSANMIVNLNGATFASPPSNNSADSEITGFNPNFVASPPVNATDWRLNPAVAPTPANYAIGGGIPVPGVLSDFLRVPRPVGAIDKGATEQ